MEARIRILKNWIIVLWGVALWLPMAYGQTTSKIVGTVTDAYDGTPLHGVNVVVHGTYLGAATNVDGYFHILNVPVGSYEIEASMIGYKRTTLVDVLVAVDQVTRLDFEMEATALEGETVTVTAERDILHKEISNSQQVALASQIEEAPAIRTINEFLGSLAGVTQERRIEIRGGTAEQTGTIVNGLSFVNQRIGKAEASIPLSAIEQVSLQTGGFSAEYGNFRSGILSVITKTGEKDRYHGTFSYSRNVPHMKRFGKSLYDPTNAGMRPYLDPIISFLGTDAGWLVSTGYDTVEAEYLEQQHETFTGGWNTEVSRYNRGKPADQQATPMDLYLWAAWMYQTVPDFAALDTLYPQYPITEEQKQAIRDHAHEPEGTYADYDLDFGLGGPLPLLSRALGDATFYFANKTTNFNYTQPVMRNGEFTSISMLTIKANLSKQTTLKLNGLYRVIEGTQTTFPSDGTIPDLKGGGDTMPINNLNVFADEVPDRDETIYKYYWHPTFWQPKTQTTIMGGFTIDHMVSSETFWNLSCSYAWHRDYFKPRETRDMTAIINFGPIWVNEQPYGVLFSPDTVFNPEDRLDYYVWDRYESPPGMNRRFSSKVGEYHENSVTQQLRFKYDFSSQVNRSNLIKLGTELNYFDLDNDNWRWWEDEDTNYEMRDHRTPWQLGSYIQDQISLQGMEGRVGVRFDYYNSGGGVWPSDDPWNEAAFTKGTEGDDKVQLRQDLESGTHIIWERWHAIDDSLGGTFLKKTKNWFTVSPRIGISFPITERSKFFFNYGHFRSPTPYSQMFMYKMRFYKRGLFNIGNPNLEPPRTISYELGAAYNLLDQYLIQLSTYYKDVTGEAADVEYNNISGTLDYHGWMSNRWENDQGFELRISKDQGAFLTGWLNFWYVIDKNGNSGREYAYEDSVRNAQAGALYGGEENSPAFIPRVAANISFHTPKHSGPQFFGVDWLGGWMISVLPQWRRGDLFTHNPADIRNLTNNLRWPDYKMVDMKLAKSVSLGNANLNFYIDIGNVFNFKVMNLNEEWTFGADPNRDSYEWAFRSEQDRENYFNSLHLSMYNSPEYDLLREKNPGMYIPGNDKVGELRSAKKPYINDPDNTMFLYTHPRDIWFGMKISF